MGARKTALAGLALALAACSQTAREPAPRNLLLISIDTLRPDHLSCYGHDKPTSPTLDALAARGLRFTDVSAAAPWTLPSHATMLTGLYPSHHGVKTHETRLPESIVTLAEEFQTHGYHTLAVVNTWNVGAAQFDLLQGFERSFYVPETHEDQKTAQPRSIDGAPDVLAKAREFLGDGRAGTDSAQPFFLFLHFYDVHTDFTPRRAYKEQFVTPYKGRLTGRTQQLMALRDRGETLTGEDLRFLTEMYDAEIRQLDDQLAEFMTWLDARGALADTLVVVTSDHGEEFQEHGQLLHGRTEYQEVLHVPLLLAGPGLPAGKVITAPVGEVDLVPTLLALFAIPSSQARDGLDLAPLWRGGTLSARDFFAEADHTNRVEGEHRLDTKRMVRRGDDKLHLDRPTGRVELYDLAQDPAEQHDLSAARADTVAALRAALERFQAGEIAPESIPQPTSDEQRLLDELGYGGDADSTKSEGAQKPGGEKTGGAKQ